MPGKALLSPLNFHLATLLSGILETCIDQYCVRKLRVNLPISRSIIKVLGKLTLVYMTSTSEHHRRKLRIKLLLRSLMKTSLVNNNDVASQT